MGMGFADCVMAMVRFRCGAGQLRCIGGEFGVRGIFRRRGYQQLRMKFGCVCGGMIRGGVRLGDEGFGGAGQNIG